MWNLKNGTDHPICSRNRDTDVENRPMYMGEGWREWGRGMNWEIRIAIYIYILPCIKQIASKNLLYRAQLSALW